MCRGLRGTNASGTYSEADISGIFYCRTETDGTEGHLPSSNRSVAGNHGFMKMDTTASDTPQGDLVTTRPDGTPMGSDQQQPDLRSPTSRSRRSWERSRVTRACDRCKRYAFTKVKIALLRHKES
jgi:hypothetical protein